MPNRRRIGYMPGRRFDEAQNVQRQKSKRKRLNRAQDTGDGAPDTPKLEEWSKTELYALARERDIKGRSTMTKERLIRSLRKTA